ncbi:hypothetical protein ACFX2I_042962 [Malus domestica]
MPPPGAPLNASATAVNQVGNEDVIKSVPPLAASNGFPLETPFPEWHRPGVPSVEGGPATNQRRLTEPA